MGLAVADVALRGGRVLFVVHTEELVDQAAENLRLLGVDVGVIKAGRAPNPWAPIQVASVQTLVARNLRPEARVVIFDEAHHYGSDGDWGELAKSYDKAAILGLTATPERGDGKPLLGLFQEMVVAANYPDLLEAGHLVPLKIIRPGTVLEGIAQDPVESYLKFGEGQKGFLFAGGKALCEEYTQRFCESGVEAVTIHDKTPKDDRRAYLDSFKRGTTRIICNVNTMTEGVDVPDAVVCILAATIRHVTPYLQRCGRILRPTPDGSKKYGILIDLPGNSLDTAHGSPVMAREFSLGEGIKKKEGVASLKVCVFCGFTYPPGPVCPQCRFRAPAQEQLQMPRIYDVELQAVFDGPNTPDWAKRRELERLVKTAEEQKWPLPKVSAIYADLFGERPDLAQVVKDEARVEEYRRLLKKARAENKNLGWAAHRFKAQFGFFPPRGWDEEVQDVR